MCGIFRETNRRCEQQENIEIWIPSGCRLNGTCLSANGKWKYWFENRISIDKQTHTEHLVAVNSQTNKMFRGRKYFFRVSVDALKSKCLQGMWSMYWIPLQIWPLPYADNTFSKRRNSVKHLCSTLSSISSQSPSTKISLDIFFSYARERSMICRWLISFLIYFFRRHQSTEQQFLICVCRSNLRIEMSLIYHTSFVSICEICDVWDFNVESDINYEKITTVWRFQNINAVFQSICDIDLLDWKRY